MFRFLLFGPWLVVLQVALGWLLGLVGFRAVVS
jgi:hypothetical protein